MTTNGAATVELEKAEPKSRKKKANTERWVSQRFSEHTIVCNVDGKSEAVKFKDFALTLNLDDEHDAKVSAALRSSNRYGRDVFVVGEVTTLSSLGDKTEMMKKLHEMEVPQLRAMLTLDEMIEHNVPVNSTDRNDFIPVILEIKKFK